MLASFDPLQKRPAGRALCAGSHAMEVTHVVYPARSAALEEVEVFAKKLSAKMSSSNERSSCASHDVHIRMTPFMDTTPQTNW